MAGRDLHPLEERRLTTAHTRGRAFCPFVATQKGKIAAAVAALEAEVSSLGDAPTIATITVGCALGYLDFRLPGEDWRSGHPALTAWNAEFAARPSMVASVPQDPV